MQLQCLKVVPGHNTASSFNCRSSNPTATILLSTFREDCSNFNVLQARLRQFIVLTTSANDFRFKLAAMPIIPAQNQVHAPRDLAFKGLKGNY